MYNEIVSIVQIDDGYIVATDSVMDNESKYTPTIGQALARVLYRLLRREGDMPYPDNKVEGTDEIYESETYKSIRVFLESFGPKAVQQALKENLEEAKQFDEEFKEENKVMTTKPPAIITEDGVQDI